uniref:ANK_REP_REGION domain-containing protein n=3 Tax=gambiae species complex TaxID=44542 RepID=A0A182VE25_ANOME
MHTQRATQANSRLIVAGVATEAEILTTPAQPTTHRMSSKSTFFYELARKSENEIQATLMRCPSHITERDESERLLVHWAALVGQERLVESILERHPDQLNAEDDAGLTPLILATLGRHPAIVTMLTFRGANVHQRSRRGHSALQYACSKNQPAIARHLVQLGANVDVVDYLNETPLHRATAIGSTELIGLLIEAGASPNIPNSEGNTPLHMACEEDKQECALELVRGGANLELQNRYEKTPLDLASRSLRQVLSASVASRRQAG